MDIRKLGFWLGLTPQEFDILQCIYRLQLDGYVSSAKDLQNKYRRRHGKILEKANLFKILKKLKKEGLVFQPAHGQYALDFEGIKSSLKIKRVEYEQTLTEFDELNSEVEAQMKKAVYNFQTPKVEFLDHDKMYARLTELVPKATTYYVVGKFPKISYTTDVSEKIGRCAYLQKIYDGTFVKNKLNLLYVTHLDVDYLYRHALKQYENPKTAYDESLHIIGRLKRQIETTEKMQVYYVENLFGLDLVLPENKTPLESFHYIRDNKKEIMGAIYIKSQDIASKAKEMYLRECENGINLNTNKGKKILKQKTRELKKKYKQ